VEENPETEQKQREGRKKRNEDEEDTESVSETDESLNEIELMELLMLTNRDEENTDEEKKLKKTRQTILLLFRAREKREALVEYQRGEEDIPLLFLHLLVCIKMPARNWKIKTLYSPLLLSSAHCSGLSSTVCSP
jgi:hypothetical protein